MILLLLFFTLLAGILLSWINLIRDIKRSNVPGNFPLPLLGNGHEFMVNSIEFMKVLQRLAEKYKGAARFYLFSDRYVVLSHPKYIEPLISSSELITKGKSYTYMLDWLGQGLLTATGQRWRTHRKFLTPAFHFNILQNFLPVFCKNERIFQEKLRTLSDGEPVNLFPIVALAALDNITESIMGVSVNAQRDKESKYVKSIENLCGICDEKIWRNFPNTSHPSWIRRLTSLSKLDLGTYLVEPFDPNRHIVFSFDDIVPNMYWYGCDMGIRQDKYIISIRIRNPFIANETIFSLSPYKKRHDEALSVLHGQARKVIEARKQDLKKLNITSLGAESELGIRNKHAFLDLLLLSKIDGQRINDEKIREEVDTFMFEGHDTTTSGIAFCLYNISKHEDVQRKLYNEQKAIFGDDMNRDPTYNEIRQMKYLDLVIKESLRLHPSVPLIERKITHDADLAGLQIPRNTNVIINIFQMQRNPDVYEDPLTFNPARFESTNTEAKSAFNWLPFSAGPRNCIGQKFAMLEMKVMISGVVRNFKLLPSGIEPELYTDLVLRSKDGLYVKLKSRD